MGCGLPIVATNVGGHREFITEGANGLLVPPHDVRALGTALEQMAGLLADPERRRELRAAARAAVLPFDQDTVLDRFAQVLEDLTSVAARRSATVGQGT
jgi:glycosyltransferase involved in cell wall biosynthesis